MIFYDIEKIIRDRGIDNKYRLTGAVADRARQLSEQKGRRLIEEAVREKYISLALEEISSGKVVFVNAAETKDRLPEKA